MPPPESGKKLTPNRSALLGTWIEQGAAYQKHWAFEPPVRPELPAVTEPTWPRNDVDRFILATLEAKQLAPSPEASKETLIRRVTLDLTGLPPTPAGGGRLPGRHGARTPTSGWWTACWPRPATASTWRGTGSTWRATATPTGCTWTTSARCGLTAIGWWSAFNRNLPFDQFTIWQLAGDLLPNPTREQLVASGFNRCNVSTSEGGAIDEEFQVRYAVDRVETTSTVWLGLTMGCAVCHDHKLDPITQKEFYQVFSIFNNIAEKAMDGNALLPPPMLKLPTPEQEKQLDGVGRAAGRSWKSKPRGDASRPAAIPTRPR